MTILAVTFCLVFLRGLQQQNVIHGQYIAAAITPYLIACGEVASVLLVVKTGWTAIPWVGTGGALGITASMWVHRRFRS